MSQQGDVDRQLVLRKATAVDELVWKSHESPVTHQTVRQQPGR